MDLKTTLLTFSLIFFFKLFAFYFPFISYANFEIIIIFCYNRFMTGFFIIRWGITQKNNM